MSKLKFMLIGFDGCDYNLLLKNMESGNMPCLKMLWDEHDIAIGKLRSQDAVTGISWTNICTGVGKEVHGVTDGWGRPYNGSKSFATVKNPYLWDIFNRYNRTVGVFSMPCTYPPKMVMGWFVSGFPTPMIKMRSELPGVPDKIKTSVSYPPELQEKYLGDYCPDIVQMCCEEMGMNEPGPQQWVTHWTGVLNTEVLIKKIRRLNNSNISALRNILKEHPVDTVFCQFGFVDRIGHLLGMNGEGEKEAYREMDRVFCDLITRFPAENIAVVSDHGFQNFGHTNDGIFLIRSEQVRGEKFEAVDVDVVPTVLYMSSFVPFAPLDGKPIYEIFKKAQMSPEDARAIDEHLRKLGYLDKEDL